MSIERELEKGNFVIGECSKCKKNIWPPSEFCNSCFGDVIIKQGSFEGKIIEFSKKDQEYFCLAEFAEQVKIMGRITSGIPLQGQRVSVKKCGIKDKSYFFEFSLIN